MNQKQEVYKEHEWEHKLEEFKDLESDSPMSKETVELAQNISMLLGTYIVGAGNISQEGVINSTIILPHQFELEGIFKQYHNENIIIDHIQKKEEFKNLISTSQENLIKMETSDLIKRIQDIAVEVAIEVAKALESSQEHISQKNQ